MTGKMVENKEEILKDIISDYEKKERGEQRIKERGIMINESRVYDSRTDSYLRHKINIMI